MEQPGVEEDTVASTQQRQPDGRALRTQHTKRHHSGTSSRVGLTSRRAVERVCSSTAHDGCWGMGLVGNPEPVTEARAVYTLPTRSQLPE